MTVSVFAKANHLNAQYFIELLPDSTFVKCGRFDELDTLQITKVYFVHENESAQWSMDSAINLLAGLYQENPLFYIHGFYASTPGLTQRTVLAYNKFFLKDTDNRTTNIVHLIWASNKLSYKNSRQNIQKTKKKLAQLLLQIEQTLGRKINLMCHSMGNQLLMESIKNGYLTQKIIHKLILAAPDFDRGDFDLYKDGLSYIADNVLVLVNRRDKILAVSRLWNQEKRLGQAIPKGAVPSNFAFIDCSKMPIHHSIIAKINRHTYFLASDSVRTSLHLFLNDDLPGIK